MRQWGAVLLTTGVALVLGGCGLFQPKPPEPLVLTATVAGTSLKVLFEVTGATGAQEFRWSFGDGAEPTVTRANVVAYHYAEPGAYAVVCEVIGGEADVGRPEPGGPPTRVVAGEPGVRAVGTVVYLGGEGPRAVIVLQNHYSMPVGDTVISYLPVTLYGEASYDPAGRGLAYWWEVVRVDPDTLEPIPYPPHADGYQPPIEFIRRQDMNWTIFFRGPGCTGRPWMYRIILRVTDYYNRQHEAVRYVTVL